MHFHDFSKINFDRMNAFHNHADWTLGDWGNALAGETGEGCNLIKKLRRGDKIDKLEIVKELADIITYADLIATQLGYSLEDVLIAKFNEVSDRWKYPIKIGENNEVHD